MGTRFLASKESPVHENMKRAIAEASELDTALIFRPLKNTARVFKNAVATQVNEIEREKGQDMKFDYIMDLVAGVKGKAALTSGEIDGGIWTSGMVQGLIDSYPSCAEIIDDIISECVGTINQRLAVFIND
jgi:nitronate monooxygenase